MATACPWSAFQLCALNFVLHLQGLLEPAPLSFLVPVRILLGVAYGGIYEQVGMTLPRLQGALVHAAGLLVAVLVDWHYRCLYKAYKARHQSKSEAALDLGPRHRASTSKAAQAEQESLKRGSLITTLRQRRYRYKSKSAQMERAPKGGGPAVWTTQFLCPTSFHRLGDGCVAGMAIRAGCVVVCFDVCKMASEGQQPSMDNQDVRVLAMTAAQEWRQGLGLGTHGGEGGEAPIAMLACLNCQAGQQNLEMATLCSMEARCPVLVMPPKATTHAIQDNNSSPNGEQHMPQRQGDPTHKPPASAAVQLPLVVDVTAPANLGVVRGWHGPADSPEELEDKESSLCLLAAVQGCFVPLDILRVEGTRVELSVTLPSELAATISSSTSAELELWAGGKLACSSTVLLVPASRAQVAVELALWTQELPATEATGFVKDLAHYLHLRQNCYTITSNSAAHTPVMQQLVAVGKGAEGACVHAPAGALSSAAAAAAAAACMLLDSLAQPPLSLTFAALASEAFAYEPELAGDPLQETGQADSGADGSHITVQDMVAAARHSGNAAVLAQCQVWEAQQAGFAPISSGPAPPTCPADAICPAAPTHPAAVMLWQRIVMVLPLWSLIRRARTKTAAAFSALAAGSRSSGSGEAAARAAAESREYRAWVIDHTGTLTKAYFKFSPMHLSILLLKSYREDQLDTDAPALAFLTATYLFIALGVQWYPKCTEIFAVVAFLGRLITNLALGTGLWPIPSSFSVVYKCRTDAILEIFVVSCMEPVRIPWLIPLRIILAGGYTTLYAKSGFTHPLLEALAVNGAGLLVSMLMDRRHRNIYAWHRANTDRARRGARSSAIASAAPHSIEQTDQDAKIRKSTSEKS
ncbi:hypothetical protein DUNSADRAFT_1183 [Dunaliella salina]|uniref:Very-long-chain (3R)-3-hydroxyacyl-CoA dehydratase n=1 Tax=Dunaliella salina TaxID=3046 RepID=A0ABQ7FXW4_DUNSA|nr:hypothetical protein DUNSADRAFT_1183 [Dunaliella salina]|eukprot:KAF5827185.1 hypothetical protein DUNSADRAFT_1183 [Dunaliella salina]